MRFISPRILARTAGLLTGLALAAAWPSGARAQEEGEEGPPEEREFRFDLSIYAGFHWFADDHGLGRSKNDPPGTSPANAPTFGARLALNFNRWVAIEGEGSAIATQLRNEQSDMFAFGYRASLLVHLYDKYAFRPFLAVGYGGLTTIIQEDPVEDVVPDSDTDGFIHAGGGFKIGFGDRTGLRVDGRIMFPGAVLGESLPIGDELGYGGPDFEVLGSLYLQFGEVPRSRTIVRKEVTVVAPPTPKDPDGDGITDADKCPEAAEDRDGFQDEDGCPEGDNDADGIPDSRDKCPNDAEDKDGTEDDDGCPDVDNDKDGIQDARDKCPTDSEDKDAFEDDDGCPELDNDKDGIPDARDKCPNEAETKNQYQDDDGCPDEVPKAVKQFTGVIEGINYKTGSAEILPGSYAVLDRAVKVLQDYPDVNLEISGHTDSRGRADYNRDLSQRRADSVKNYFVSRGIDPKRLISIGYGMDRPIADNRSEAGRSRNRRTEFRLINPGEK